MAFRNPAILATGDGQQYVEVGNDPTTGEPKIMFHTGATSEVEPGVIRSSGETQTSPLELELRGPVHQNAGGAYPSISLQTYATGERDMNLYADRIGASVPILNGVVWVGVGGSFLNGWTDVAGGRVGYYMDSAGNVHVRGIVNSGTAVGLWNMGTGYWPDQTMEFVCRGGNPGPLMCSVQVTNLGAVSILTNFAAAQARLSLDFTYPALGLP